MSRHFLLSLLSSLLMECVVSGDVFSTQGSSTQQSGYSEWTAGHSQDRGGSPIAPPLLPPPPLSQVIPKNVIRERAIEAALLAGEVIRTCRNLQARLKADASPVTEADTGAQLAIVNHLACFGLPIISEEQPLEMLSTPVPENGYWWVVDPLDGTKVFLGGGPEFTVNIALVQGRRPIMGVIYYPATDALYYGETREDAPLAQEIPSFEEGQQGHSPRILGDFEHLALRGTGQNGNTLKERLVTRPLPPKGAVVLISPYYLQKHALVAPYLLSYPEARVEAVSGTSKFCRLVDGTADVSLELEERTCEWDVAAAHVLLLALGGNISYLDGTPFIYGNRSRMNWRNAPYIALAKDNAKEAVRISVPIFEENFVAAAPPS